jgi:hydroxymethylpyrimidine pyrophosphatase-like HAD family hydrolase
MVEVSANHSTASTASAASSIRALAVDYDGTLTDGGPPGAAVLQALADARARGVAIVLVTGRILSELRAEMPDADAVFDAIVGENGAVLAIGGVDRILAPMVAPALDDVLRRRGIGFRRGQAILAAWSHDATAVFEAIGAVGLEDHIIHNRGAIMVVPPGVTKGSGVVQALAALGISPHCAVGVGDAENDHSLLDTCELGAAVANAIPSLLAHADIRLRGRSGDGIIELLNGPPFIGGPVRSHRWRLALGTFDDGTAATIPASQVRVVVRGESGSGKSYLAGLLCEQLIAGGYSVGIIDPEGDYLPLADLPGTIAFGGSNRLPTPPELARFLRHHLGSIVIDLSGLSDVDRRSYQRELIPQLTSLREDDGLPHWLFVDECHLPSEDDRTAWQRLLEGPRELCLITYQTESLSKAVVDAADVLIRTLPPSAQGHQLLIERAPGLAEPRVVTVQQRAISHVRHWHKYVHSLLPPHHRFRFRRPNGSVVGEASNVEDFARQLATLDLEVVRHHVSCGDFSRWLADVLQDHELALTIRTAERSHGAATSDAVRATILAAVRRRYLDTEPRRMMTVALSQ